MTTPGAPRRSATAAAGLAVLLAGCALPAVAMLQGFGSYRVLLPAIAIAAACGIFAVRTFGAIRAARWLIVIVTAASHFLVLAPLAIGVWDRGDRFRDTPAYYLAIERGHDERPLYADLPPGPHRFGNPEHYLYPPFFVAAGMLAPRGEYMTFNRVWLAIGLLGFWGFAVALAGIATGRLRVSDSLVAGMVVGAVPGALSGIIVGQIDPLLWLLAGLAVGLPLLRGVGLALIASVKVYAVWPLLFAALRRDRRVVLLGAGATALALLAVGIGTLGAGRLVGETLRWFRVVSPSLSQGQFQVMGEGVRDPVLAWLTAGNLSLGFLPLQLAHLLGWDPGSGNLPVVLRVYLLLIGTAAPILAGIATRHRHAAYQCAIVLAAAGLFAPVFRASYAPVLLLVPAAWLLERRSRPPAASADSTAVV